MEDSQTRGFTSGWNCDRVTLLEEAEWEGVGEYEVANPCVFGIEEDGHLVVFQIETRLDETIVRIEWEIIHLLNVFQEGVVVGGV